MAERICSVEDCAGTMPRGRYCAKHYWRLRTYGSLDLPARRSQRTEVCQSDDCQVPIDPARNKSGLCKSCYRRRWYVENGDHERATMAGWRERNREYDRQRWAEYYRDNAERLRAAGMAYYQENQAMLIANAAAWRERNREAINARGAERRRTDPGWPLRNRENQRRRRRRPGSDPVDYAAILAEHGMTCHICNKDIASMSDLHFDHVIPLSRGGPHSADNIRPAHAFCNQSKGARIA